MKTLILLICLCTTNFTFADENVGSSDAYIANTRLGLAKLTELITASTKHKDNCKTLDLIYTDHLYPSLGAPLFGYDVESNEYDERYDQINQLQEVLFNRVKGLLSYCSSKLEFGGDYQAYCVVPANFVDYQTRVQELQAQFESFAAELTAIQK